MISVLDASINEIGNPSAFVSAGSGGLDAPMGITLGPDGNVYVAGNNGAVRRYNGDTGQYINTFVAQGSGGLSDVWGLTFGPDGNLYVASGATDQILRYNGATGGFLDAFVPAGSGGLDYPRGITFGTDGNLYVSSYNTNSVLRYGGPMTALSGSPSPASGQPGAGFVAPSSGGLYQPINLAFGPDGNLYIDGMKLPGILRFDGTTGAFVDTFVPNSIGGLAAGRGMAFDQEGWLYVGDSYNNVHRYDSLGNSLGDLLVNPASLELSTPNGLIFDSRGALLISSSDFDAVMRYDRGIVVNLLPASLTTVTANYTTLDSDALASTDYYAQSGTVNFKPGQTTRRILLATRDDLESDEPNETFKVQLSNPVDATLNGTGIATVTIFDEDTTRQVSIADASATEGSNAAHYRGSFVQGIPGIGFTPLAFGPDGNLYTSFGRSSMTIDRYDGTTGDFLNRVVPEGRLKAARDIVFSNGYLLVGSEDTDEVLRYNVSSGAFVDAFVSAGSGGIDGPHGLTFGPDANGDNVPELYVSGRNSFNVVRYDGATGAPLPGTYVTTNSGGLAWPEGLTFDSNGSHLYVTSTGTNQVLKYNAQTGAYVGVGASTGLSAPKGVKFGADSLMYITSGGNNRILRYTASGAYVDDYVPAGSGGMTNPSRLTFGPDGDLYVTQYNSQTGNGQIMRFGTASEAIFTVSLTTRSTLPLKVNFTMADVAPGSAVAGSDYTATSGTVTFAPGYTTATIRVPILDDTPATTELTETFFVNISLHPMNLGAGTIADPQALGTILDNDPFTKFYVVNDASTDRTYEYGATGTSVENYALGSGNTAPRGASSTSLGTTVWVVDANRNVYAYDTSGALQGSWAAGGLQATAQLEGIATNGTDVWLVDRTADKVHRYTNAASRTSGSQNSASSFSLNSGNTNPKDIVTDGIYLWVVDDSSTDKVFKYTVAGTFVGSWRISTAGAKSPTGITLDPSNPSHIWIVDSGTDRVYQYDNAVGLTSGSKSANSNWALAAGNTNPQGIADPPPPSASLNTAPGSAVSNSAFSGSFLQAPIVWLGAPSTERVASLRSVLAVTKGVDEYMSQLASLLPAAPISVSKAPSNSVPSQQKSDETQADQALGDEDLSVTLHTIANDLFESAFR